MSKRNTRGSLNQLEMMRSRTTPIKMNLEAQAAAEANMSARLSQRARQYERVAEADAAAAAEIGAIESMPRSMTKTVMSYRSGWGSVLFGFFFIFLLVWMILFAFRPSWVLLEGSPDKTLINSINFPRLLLYTVLITLLVLLVLYLLKKLC